MRHPQLFRAHRFAASLILSTCLAACGAPDEPAPPPPPKVEGDTVIFPEGSAQLGALNSVEARPRSSEKRMLTGRLVWNEDLTVRLMPVFAGRVLEVLVKPGDVVKAGQPLARLASPDFGQVQTDAMSARSSFNLARANRDRSKELYEQGVAARKDYESAQAEFERSEAEWRRSEARQRLYGRSAGNDQKLTVSAPIAGTIVERNLNIGQELRPDQALPQGRSGIFVITDPSSLWVMLDAQERDLHSLRVGDRILIMVQALSDEAFPATIGHIADTLDPESRTIKVRAEIDNVDRKLKAEMFVVAQATYKTDQELELPARAVFLEGSRQYVFVEQAPGRYQRRAVVIRPELDSHVEVLKGLNAGERVVNGGALLLQRLLQQNEAGAGRQGGNDQGAQAGSLDGAARETQGPGQTGGPSNDRSAADQP